MGDHIFVWTFTDVVRAIILVVALLVVLVCLTWAAISVYILTPRRERRREEQNKHRGD